MTAEEKKIRRLARNRESARQSRRRKKQYLELLEDKVEQLTHEVNALRQKRLEQAPKELHQHWANSIVALAKQLESARYTPAMASNPGVERTLLERRVFSAEPQRMEALRSRQQKLSAAYSAEEEEESGKTRGARSGRRSIAEEGHVAPSKSRPGRVRVTPRQAPAAAEMA